MTSARPAARARAVTGTIAVASFLGIVAAFQVAANASPLGTLATGPGPVLTPTPAPTTALPTAPPTAIPVVPAPVAVTHPAAKPVPVAKPVPAPAPAPAPPPVARTRPSGGG